MSDEIKAAENIFTAAKALPSDEQRRAYLDIACGKNPALRQQIERLLSAANEADGFFAEKPADLTDLPDTILAPTRLAEGPGTRIGRYKLLQQIGEGGMGVVYMAEQEEPVRRRVALKIIKLGMDTKQVVARFEAERQALALMDHPNIAKVLDGGATDTGRPYFVMELVQGVPITEFCDKAKLSARERLKLFILVCQAIQSAHQKGIIHRDIKPSNVMVTLHDGVPVPKVIDFGIAKATNQKLTEKTLFTNFSTMIGTPAYMSPEQAEMSGLDIDTRTDIYALGVLLYALLTGTTPFPEKRLRSLGYGEMQRVIREEEPERPSTRLTHQLVAADVRRLKPSHESNEPSAPEMETDGASSRRLLQTKELINLLKGDLDWIVMKCLEKDRQRRYETANGLASDIQRHLSNEPVIARPPTIAYRLQKGFRRNRVAFSAGIAVSLVLVLGLVATSWQAVRAMRAEREQGRSREAAELAAARETTAREAAVSAKSQAEEEKRNAQEVAERRRQETYAAEMRAAQIALEFGNLGQCRKLLLKYKPKSGEDSAHDLRGIEWRYLWQESASQALTEFRLGSAAAGAAMSPDGRWLATTERAGRIVIWNVKARNKIHEEKTHVKEPENWIGAGPAFSSDGTMLASCSSNGIRVLSVKNWKTVHELPGDYFSVAFANRSNVLAAAGSRGAAVWHFDSVGQEPTVGTSHSGRQGTDAERAVYHSYA